MDLAVGPVMEVPPTRATARVPWRFLLGVFLLVKVLAAAVGMIGILAVQSSMDLGGLGHYQGNDIGPFSMWFQWDSRWYLELARTDWLAPLSSSAQAYVDRASADPSFVSPAPTELHRFAFFPLFPLLVKALGTVLLGHETLAATLIVNGALFGCLVLVHQVGHQQFGTERDARLTVAALAALPMSFLLQAAMTESLFLLLLLATILLALRDRWWGAAACGFLLALTRSTGMLIALPLLVIAVRRYVRRPGGPDWRALTRTVPAVLAPGLGFATFIGWCQWRTGDAMAYRDIQRAGWKVSFAGPWQPVRDTFAADASPMLAVKLTFVAVVLVALAVSVTFLHPAHVVAGALLVLVPLSIGDPWTYSILRYLSVVYPLALAAVALVRRRPALGPYLLSAGVALQAVFLLIWCLSFTFQII